MKTATDNTAQVGRSVPRLEGREKVTGRAEYIHNMRLPGMLYGKIFRSTAAHARIRSIDVTAAAAVDGVHRVITADDIRTIVPDPYYGPVFRDQPVLAIDKVRHVGEPVALVLAADPHIAETAAQLIAVEYDELPAVFDEVEATTPSAAIVHDVLRPAGMFPDLKHLQGRRNTNLHLDFKLRRGDVDAAFAAADHVFEHTFHTRQVMHTPLEPLVSLAESTPSSVTIHTASQMPSVARVFVAALLGWPENRVRIRTAFLGGGFGAKTYIKLEALVAIASLLTRRPVKIALTMEEQFFVITKHANTLRLKSAVTRDGRITARRCEVWWNGGAYADIGPRLTQKSGFTAAGPYDIDNVHIDSYAVYTNLPPAAGLRGFGIPTLTFAYESHTDLIARALKIDPLEFRRKNILRGGRPQATGTPMKDAAIEAVLERLAKRMNWDAPFDRGQGTLRRGRGIAIGFKASISHTTSVAIVNLYADGSCSVYCNTVDMGQGSDTAMAQIAAEALNIPAESVKVVHADTDVTPFDMGTLGSRSTFHMGNAVRLAAEDARDKQLALAAELGLPPETTPAAELFRGKYGMQAGNIVGIGTFNPHSTPPDLATGLSPDITPFWMVGGTGAEVEVDTATGHVRIIRLVNIADLGKPINPKIVETQLSGAAVMQLGCTMSERMEYVAGQLTNGSLADYKIPGMRDMPQHMENDFVDSRQHSGPHGAKGVGETATFGVSPAIANAIHDAVGVRITALPVTAEAVYRALRANNNDPLEDK
ncbi:MAG: xanthine dehydrogenase family protein molybdopterin-binding subunit [Betaproteobacteria bacterium]|nr:xanthine dehydrogenase family protein molybdopterin-binding subunit [Betaproteobacteria bacterium]MBI2291309.1 xanthine dehydrogenase family protein molybdopterin-binding subunit [Betaproteobacteria bacterium]